MVSQLDELISRINDLEDHQVAIIAGVVNALGSPLEYSVAKDSDFATEEFGTFFGDVLRLHHCFSGEPFTKDKFEHAMVRVLRHCNHDASLAPRGNPGHDMTVGDKKWSLKTQADASIDPDSLYMSKFMELGKGRWVNESDLEGLRDRMFEHMKAYDRIFMLRCLSRNKNHRPKSNHSYELVEIPKALLLESENGTIEMRHNSRQNPKPGYCTVTNKLGAVRFQLYFDGGTERKLQIKNLSKTGCSVHAWWKFTVS